MDCHALDVFSTLLPSLLDSSYHRLRNEVPKFRGFNAALHESDQSASTTLLRFRLFQSTSARHSHGYACLASQNLQDLLGSLECLSTSPDLGSRSPGCFLMGDTLYEDLS